MEEITYLIELHPYKDKVPMVVNKSEVGQFIEDAIIIFEATAIFREGELIYERNF